MKLKLPEKREPERYTPEFHKGLSKEQVEERQRNGYINRVSKTNSPSILKIILRNVCTFFNFIWVCIFAINLYLYNQRVTDVGHLFFMVVIVANVGLAIFQEIRAKIQVEKLSLTTMSMAEVIRSGNKENIKSDDILLDDILFLKAGDLIPADSIICMGKIEVNESLLTGESEPVKKQDGMTLLRGSYVTSGSCYARADKIGDDCYIQHLARRAKAFKSPKSDLFRDITKFIRVIGGCIIPFALLMGWNNYRATQDLYSTLLSTTGSLQGMIPAGMFLLITVALSLGVIRLANQNTLVKNIYSIEMLARSNVICLDKTGTITDGTMRVVKEYVYDYSYDIPMAVANVISAQRGSNFTSIALLSHYHSDKLLNASYVIPFSSDRKYMAASFEDYGTFAIGAPEFSNLENMPVDMKKRMLLAARDGKRVVLLSHCDAMLKEDAIPYMTPVALILLEDHIREEAYDMIRWFNENGVEVRILSGDNPVTVSAIAKRVGIKGADNIMFADSIETKSVQKFSEDHVIYGRLTPEQKRALVKQLKANGYTVAMTGDGVNDIMALKEADCSIGLADGSDAARNVSNIVLRNNDFSSLPSIVEEGRRVINNVSRSANLYLMKTFAVIALSIACVALGMKYPLETNMLTLFEVLITGFPSLLLATEPNKSPIEGSFLKQVFRRCIPDAMLIFLSSLILVVLHNKFGVYTDPNVFTTVVTLSFIVPGYLNLVLLCFPLTKTRLATMIISAVALISAIVAAGPLFGLLVWNSQVVITLIALLVLSYPVHLGLSRVWTSFFMTMPSKTPPKAHKMKKEPPVESAPANAKD